MDAKVGARLKADTASLHIAGFEDEDDDEYDNEVLGEVARSSEGRRYRKQPKMDALREYKGEILEAHRHGLNVIGRNAPHGTAQNRRDHLKAQPHHRRAESRGRYALARPNFAAY